MEAEALVTILLIGLVALALSAAGIASAARSIRRHERASRRRTGVMVGASGRAEGTNDSEID